MHIHALHYASIQPFRFLTVRSQHDNDVEAFGKKNLVLLTFRNVCISIKSKWYDLTMTEMKFENSINVWIRYACALQTHWTNYRLFVSDFMEEIFKFLILFVIRLKSLTYNYRLIEFDVQSSAFKGQKNCNHFHRNEEIACRVIIERREALNFEHCRWREKWKKWSATLYRFCH